QSPRGNQDVQSPRGNQDVQSPRGNQNVQSPRGNQNVQSPRSSTGTTASTQAPRADISKAASLVKDAEAACKSGNMTVASDKAKAAIELLNQSWKRIATAPGYWPRGRFLLPAAVLDASEQRGLPYSARPDERHELATPIRRDRRDRGHPTSLGSRLESFRARITPAVRP